MVSPTGVWTDTNTPQFQRFAKGQGKRYIGSSSQYSRRATVPPPMKSGSFVKECSFLAVVLDNGASATTFALSYCGANSIMGIGTGATSQRAAYFFRNDASTVSDNNQATSTLTYSSAFGSVILVTRSESRNQTRMYVDGIIGLDTTAATMGTTTPVDSATGCLFRGSAGNFYTGAVALGVVWGRALTQAEAITICQNPWQIFGYPARPIILNSSAGGAVNTAVTLSAASFTYSPASLTPKTNRLVTLTGPSFTYSPNSLTQVTTRKATLSPASWSWSVQSLAAQTTRKATLSPAAFTYSPNSLTTQLTRNATLSPVSWSWTINDLTAVFVGKTAYSVTLSPAAFTYTVADLQAVTVAASLTGALPTGSGRKKRLPYGWWEGREPEEIERAIERAEDAVETAQEAISAPRQERRDAQAELNAALAQISLDANIERLAQMQAKQARARLETIAKEIATQRTEFERMRVEFEDEKKRRALLAKLRDEDDALTVLLS